MHYVKMYDGLFILQWKDNCKIEEHHKKDKPALMADEYRVWNVKRYTKHVTCLSNFTSKPIVCTNKIWALQYLPF